MKTIDAVAAFAVTITSFAATARADSCRIYSGTNQTGQSYLATLPDVDETYSWVSYGSSSVRRNGPMLDVAGSPVYENGESVHIDASQSAVVFYVYDGDQMDGRFQAVRCNKGSSCNWTFGWARNQMRSFVCQREFTGPEIPTASISDDLTTQLDTQIPEASSINNSTIRYGRMWWTNVESRCARKGVGCSDDWRARYVDLLEYNFRTTLDINNWVDDYVAWIDFWLQPQVHGDDKEFSIEETYYRVDVDDGVLESTIQDGLVDGITPLFDDSSDDLGHQITNGIWDEVLDQANDNVALANLVMKLNNRIEFSYSCDPDDVDQHLVGWPTNDYVPSVLDNPCGNGQTTNDFAPLLRLVKNFN